MQIDGHHTLTYIAARIAGFDRTKASIIATSAQYVDDATNSGTIHFDNGAMYNRISSAHKMFDYHNSDKLANHRVWIPFHFLPGNGGLPAGENPDGNFIEKLICHPDSYVARDMLRACIGDIDKPYALHRLGIAMHVYADTWSHQGFAGVNNKVNEVRHLHSNNKEADSDFFKKMVSYFLTTSFPLGHGAALSYPDRPSFVWEYTNGRGDKVTRNNPNDFIDAVDKMCKVMQCFLKKDMSMNLEKMPGIGPEDSEKIVSLMKNLKDDTGDIRHSKWIEAIANDTFSFGAERIEYNAKGSGSWKFASTGQLETSDTGKEEFQYTGDFLKSDWKLFHDALQAHRFDVLHNVLPKYGICAA